MGYCSTGVPITDKTKYCVLCTRNDQRSQYSYWSSTPVQYAVLYNLKPVVVAVGTTGLANEQKFNTGTVLQLQLHTVLNFTLQLVATCLNF